jgi:phosphohistidine phosphatase SixA
MTVPLSKGAHEQPDRPKTYYALLCRHARHRGGALIQVETADGAKEYPIDVVASRLKEQLQMTEPPGREQIRVREIRCASSDEAQETRDRLLGVLHKGGKGTAIELPDDRDDSPVTTAALQGLFVNPKADPRNAVLVIGHQPQLGRIADELMRTKRRPWHPPPAPVPLDHAGIVCIASESSDFADSWLAWAISYDDADAAEKVREKIIRKMDTAKLLGSLLVLGLTVIFGVLFDENQLNGLGERRWAAQAAAGVLLLAAVLYLATMYQYDSLLMPQRFWGETSRRTNRSRWLVERPPSSAAFVLYQNMMRIWRNLFTVATALMIAATILLGYAALHVDTWIVLLVGLPVGVVTSGWLYWSRPMLGSQD